MKLKLYFVFGKRPTGMDALEKELEENDDLIVANFSDEYNNLPLKVKISKILIIKRCFEDFCGAQLPEFEVFRRL